MVEAGISRKLPKDPTEFGSEFMSTTDFYNAVL